MNAEELAEWLTRRLPQISRLNLNPSQLSVRHVMNWGGFVNHSFYVSDGSVQYHLKLTDDLDSIGKLRKWHGIHHLLEGRYRSPEIILWMDFSDIGFQGLLQEHVGGQTADFCRNPVLVAQLIELLGHLHRDAEVQLHLNVSGSEKICYDHFVETYIDRFTADMQEMVSGQVPFVSASLFKWIEDETQRLWQIADAEDAFHTPAHASVHGDVNEGNVLVTPARWFVVDWDDIALGDPAVEFAVLLWPMIYRGRRWRDFPIPDMDESFARRMEICLRAQLLDEVIDPLADYVAARAVPSRETEIRLAKRMRHSEALERYRTLYS